TALSGLLHAPRGDFQSPPGRADRGPRHLPLARLGPQEQEAPDEPGGRGIPAPLSAARAASRICAHPAFRVLCPPALRRPAAAVPPTAHRRRELDARRRICIDLDCRDSTVALPAMWWAHDPAGAAHSPSGTTPF